MFGFYIINKPPGPSSHDMVYRVRHMIQRRAKVGHTGTLDPFAGGVMIVAVGPATRLSERIHLMPKTYRAEITLGASSTTDDTEGEITTCPDDPQPTPEAIEAAMAQFTGRIEQIPPAHSAVYIDGQRAYQLARQGQPVEIPSRVVTIHRIEILDYDYPRLGIEVDCSTGTYIRSLARDLAAAVGTHGYCSALTRTAVGPFTIDQGCYPDDLDIEADLAAPSRAVEDLPRIDVMKHQPKRIAGGLQFRTERPIENDLAAAAFEGKLVALVRVLPDRTTCRPWRVFIPPPG